MFGHPLATMVLSVAFLVVCVVCLVVSAPALYLWLQTRGKSRGALYDLLYSLNWGAATYNYGFAPADDDVPERFQFQMYHELYRLLLRCGEPPEPKRLLEVSCGRGGGLYELIKHCDGKPVGVGLDLSANAVAFCKQRYCDVDNLCFVRGSAPMLPFGDGSFDIIVNVEASHVYGDAAGFFREVHRVLRPQGAFLFADYRNRRHVEGLKQLLRHSGFAGEVHDITEHVALACELDSDRRRSVIRRAIPWYYRWLIARRLEDSVRIKGSKKFERFHRREQLYCMTCMSKSSSSTVSEGQVLSPRDQVWGKV